MRPRVRRARPTRPSPSRSAPRARSPPSNPRGTQFDAGPQGLEIPRLARGHHRGACSASRRPVRCSGAGAGRPKLALDLEGGTRIVLAGADGRGPGGHPRAARAGRVDHPPARRRVRCLRGRDQHAGHQQHRGPDPGHARQGDAGPPAVVVEARVPCRDPRRDAVDRRRRRATARTPRPRRPTARRPTPTPTPSRHLDAEPDADRRQRPELGHARAADRVRRVHCGDQSTRSRRTSRPADEPLITCDDTTAIKYLLGPVEVDGADITDAFAGQRQGSGGVNTGQLGRQPALQRGRRRGVQGCRYPPDRASVARATSSAPCSTAA